MNEPNEAVDKRREDGTFGPGNNANPAGRPKGSSMKEFWRRKFYAMTDEEKEAWCMDNKVSGDSLYKMAEGNPKQDTEIQVSRSMGDVLDALQNGQETTG